MLHLLPNESFCREQNRVAATLVLCYAVTSFLHGKGLYDGKERRRMKSERGRHSPTRAVSENFSAVGAGYASGPYTKSVCCSRNDGDGGVERREVCGVACCPLRNGVEAQRMVQPDGWSSRSSSARVRREQMSAPPSTSGRGDGLENEGIRQNRSIIRSPFNSRVDKTGLQSRMISQARCRAKLHGLFKQAQRQSRDGRFFLSVGGYVRLVGDQIARLSTCGVMILSEFLSPDFGLNRCCVAGSRKVT